MVHSLPNAGIEMFHFVNLSKSKAGAVEVRN
jgi:hypothetical protein